MHSVSVPVTAGWTQTDTRSKNAKIQLIFVVGRESCAPRKTADLDGAELVGKQHVQNELLFVSHVLSSCDCILYKLY